MANSKRLCTGCKSRFPTDELMSLPAGRFCSMTCAIGYGQKNGAKAREKAKDKEHKQLKRRVKDEDKSFQLKKTQTIFNRYIRLRDDLLPCVSCGRHHSGQLHAGHYRSVGSAPELRFEPKQVWKQCAPCNNHLSGNLINYRVELINRVGQDVVDWIEGPHKPKRYTIDELKELQKHYSQLIKGIEDE